MVVLFASVGIVGYQPPENKTNIPEPMTNKGGNTDQTVKVTIYGQEYPIKGRGDEEYIKRVACYVDERMLQIEEQTSINSPARLAILAALNIADELFNLERERDKLLNEFESKAREISECLNQGMNEV